MEPHHDAWLSSHPHRNSQWLQERLRDGFDIHHIDGDHENNRPSNLVLIEHVDHMRLHGLENSIRLRPLTRGPRPKTLRRGKLAYEKKQAGKTWREIGEGDPQGAAQAARVYAQVNGLEWPIRL